jgi:hypothetical protein
MHCGSPVTSPRKFRVLVMLICAALMISVELSAKEPSQSLKTNKEKSPTGALLRSMIVPGWGQLYNGKPLKAVIYAGAQLSFLYGAHMQNDRYHYYRDLEINDYADFYKSDRNRLLWWLFGITLLSMGDAFVDAHLYGFDVSDDLSMNISPSVSPDFAGRGLGFTVKLNFSGFLGQSPPSEPSEE